MSADFPHGFPRNLEYRDGILVVLEQTRLPAEEVYLEAGDLAAVVEAIRSLQVRGAPAIGIAAAYGLCVALGEFLRREPRAGLGEARAELARAREALGGARPTAVNLAAALARLAQAETLYCAGGKAPAAPSALDAPAVPAAPTAPKAPDAPLAPGAAGLLACLEDAARELHDEEAAVCEQIAAAGLSLLPEQARLLTHCNAGPLATGGVGTALGVIIRGHEQGRCFEVYAGETRPLLQGARLTTWELLRAGLPVRLIPDGAGPSLLLAGRIDAVIVGADRIAANGDTANKVGTLPLALAASRAGVPFYVAAPLSSFDPATPGGAAIPIEERAAEEVTHWAGRNIAPDDIEVYNPAFDVTPGDLVTAFLTEHGVLRPPYDFSRLPPSPLT